MNWGLSDREARAKSRSGNGKPLPPNGCVSRGAKLPTRGGRHGPSAVLPLRISTLLQLRSSSRAPVVVRAGHKQRRGQRASVGRRLSADARAAAAQGSPLGTRETLHLPDSSYACRVVTSSQPRAMRS